jgi:membrane protease subunit (stomatin/prohibitin family)
MIRSKDEQLGLRQMQQQEQGQEQGQKQNPSNKGKATAKTFLPRLRGRVAKKQLTEPSWL